MPMGSSCVDRGCKRCGSSRYCTYGLIQEVEDCTTFVSASAVVLMRVLGVGVGWCCWVVALGPSFRVGDEYTQLMSITTFPPFNAEGYDGSLQDWQQCCDPRLS